MNKMIVLSVLGIFIITITGCTNFNFQTSKDNDDEIVKHQSSSSNFDNQSIEGGENSRIRGYYQFNDFDDFSFFYNCFKEKNTERYLVPNDQNKEFTFEYAFLSEGVLKSDFETKQYNIIYPNQTMFLNLWINDIEINGTCFDVSSLDKSCSLNIKYELKEFTNNTYKMFLFTKDNYQIYEAVIKNSSENIKLYELCQKIVYEFEKGVI